MKRTIFAVFVCALLVSAGANAQTLYGTILDLAGPSSTLVEIDAATGAQIGVIGPVGYAVNGMTYDATTDTLYATTSTGDPMFPNCLLTVDPTTGAGTPIGSGAGQLVNVPAANSAGQVYGWTESGDDLVIWDTAAGTVTVVGESGIPTRQQGLAFDGSDNLYLVQDGGWASPPDQTEVTDVFAIDTTTGAASFVGSIGLLEFGVAHHGSFNPSDGYYYGIDRNPSMASSGFQIAVLDIGGLSIVRMMATEDNLHTLCFAGAAQPPTPTPTADAIPTVSNTGLVVMIVLLAGAALVLVRRFF